MFNRALQVKMVKNETKQDTAPTSSNPTYQEKVAVIGHHLGRVVEKAGKAVITYVLVDTLRQVAIEKAKK